MSTVVALLGAGLGFGLWLAGSGLSRRPRTPSVRPRRRGLTRGVVASRTATASVAAVVGGLVTQWVAGALLVGLAVWFLPRFLAREKERARQLARVESVASWAELMRDTLAAAAGLEQAILASAPVAPDPIHREINALAVRLETGQRLAPSLTRLADDLADPTADLVIAALRLAATQQARNVGDLLGSLAASAREQASMRLRVEAGRARTRTSVRIIVVTTCAFAGLLVVLNREYVAAYDDAAGQLVLVAVGGLFAAGFVGLAKIAAVAQPARLLDHSGGAR